MNDVLAKHPNLVLHKVCCTFTPRCAELYVLNLHINCDAIFIIITYSLCNVTFVACGYHTLFKYDIILTDPTAVHVCEFQIDAL